MASGGKIEGSPSGPPGGGWKRLAAQKVIPPLPPHFPGAADASGGVAGAGAGAGYPWPAGSRRAASDSREGIGVWPRPRSLAGRTGIPAAAARAGYPATIPHISLSARARKGNFAVFPRAQRIKKTDKMHSAYSA